MIFVDASDPKNFESSIQLNIKLLYIETFATPTAICLSIVTEHIDDIIADFQAWF